MSLTWNEFRSAHKGIAKSELSKLWESYKAGEYNFPSKEESKATVEETIVEEPDSVEEVPVEENATPIADLCGEYNRLIRKMVLLGIRLTPELKQAGEDRLSEIAKLTIPEGYSCTPTDSWKIWFGPSERTLLVNTTNLMGFEITRSWWKKYYQTTIYVDRETVNNYVYVDSEIQRMIRRKRFLPRSPVVGRECKLPIDYKDIQIRGGQGVN
jgi:hypothetical protein